ncbi:MAG TPA: M48 family metalloprotease [Tepidisphaeraceae bacterium]|jgi:predicted Zn-dependent protease
MTQFGFGQPRRGINLRWVIALVIAAVGIIGYYTKTSVNPVTGEKQHIALTAEQETALGLNSAPQMAREMGGEVSPNDPQARLVAEVGNRIWQRSDATKSPYKYTYHLVNDEKTINAFALPGGQIFITRALLNKLQNEAQLAGVLGHETGHVVGRHVAEQMAKQQLSQSLVIATAVGASDRRDGGQTAAVIASFVAQLKQLSFSRKDESEADAFGLKYMTQAGYDPRAMLGVMEILKSAGGAGGTPQIFLTHPNPDQRIEDIKTWLQQHPDLPNDLTIGRKLNAGATLDF